MNKAHLTCLVALAPIAAIQAQTVTYVDAIADPLVGTTNTVATSGDPLATWYFDAGGTNPTDSLWNRRTGFANSSDVLQAKTNDPTPGSFQELTTTITGLTPGVQYQVYTFFWDAGNTQQWTLDTGLTSGNLTLFANGSDGVSGATAALDASSLTFSSPPLITEADRTMFAADLGIVAADGSGEINIFVNNSTSVSNNSMRSWYDGVGYAAIPEPSTYALVGGFLALGIAIMARRRKA
ncbi:MAG: hypothetical protein AAFX93_08840 [Verrucomicrobiota bacterium]